MDQLDKPHKQDTPHSRRCACGSQAQARFRGPRQSPSPANCIMTETNLREDRRQRGKALPDDRNPMVARIASIHMPRGVRRHWLKPCRTPPDRPIAVLCDFWSKRLAARLVSHARSARLGKGGSSVPAKFCSGTSTSQSEVHHVSPVQTSSQSTSQVFAPQMWIVLKSSEAFLAQSVHAEPPSTWWLPKAIRLLGFSAF